MAVKLAAVLALFLGMALVGAASAQEATLQPEGSVSAEQNLGGEPYKVGPVNVWLRPQPEVEFFCRLRLPQVRRDQRVVGCYLPDSRTIISVPDPHVLLHEFKHYFEGKFHD